MNLVQKQVQKLDPSPSFRHPHTSKYCFEVSLKSTSPQMKSPRLFSLQAHGDRFYFRMAVPRDLRSIFHRREIKKRLPTNNVQTARLMSSYISSYLLDLFRNKRMQIAYNQTDSGNTLNIKDLHLDSEEELKKMFENIKSPLPSPV